MKSFSELRRLRWIHVSTVAVLEVGGLFEGLGELSKAIGYRINRYGERRLREHYRGKEPSADVES